MGTNYYAIPKATDELKKKIIEKIDANELQEAKLLIPDSIHIGKQSGGWQFCFNHNDWQYFGKSLAELEVFLLTCNIEDEYGKSITSDEFWQMVNANKEKLDNKEYYTNWEKYNKDFVTGKPMPRPNYIPRNYGQETHFGLFFADVTEFS